MSVKYSKELRDQAKSAEQPLVTIDVPGLSFQGPVTQDECDEIARFLIEFGIRRRDAKKYEDRLRVRSEMEQAMARSIPGA